MPYYVRLGQVPPKRHTRFENPRGGIYREEVFGTEGFEGAASILYHIHPPVRVARVGRTRSVAPKPWDPGAHRHHHLRAAKAASEGDALGARRVLAWNERCSIEVAAPTRPMEGFFRNATADELWFAHEGEGELRSPFGRLPFRRGDFLHVPRGTTYQLEASPGARFLILASPGGIGVPRRYLNEAGQFMEHAPYCERDLHPPRELLTRDEAGEFEVAVRVDWTETTLALDRHPFDVVGWDGTLYPFTFNIGDFEPITGRIHQPPTVHEAFCGPGFMVGCFLPRKLDYHPLAIPAPYYHSNIDTDEVLYYVGGRFTSRVGVEEGSLTLHRRGVHHGPQPGRYEGSIGMEATDETAIMVECHGHFQLTEHARSVDDADYPYSWVRE